MPGVVRSRLIEVAQGILAGLDLVGSLASGISSDGAKENSSVVEKLAELAVGDDERAEGTQTLQSLVSMLLRGVLINRCTWKRSILGLNLLCLPDEVLEEIALVLGQQEVFRLLDDDSEIGDQSLTFGGEFLRWGGQSLGLQEAVESDVDLLVGRNLATLESWKSRVSTRGTGLQSIEERVPVTIP